LKESKIYYGDDWCKCIKTQLGKTIQLDYNSSNSHLKKTINFINGISKYDV